MTSLPSSPWWMPDRYVDQRPKLMARARILKAMRLFFEEEGFVEIEPPILQQSPGNETHISAFKTEFVAVNGARVPFYLHTSPEFTCKKLLAAGERKIVSFTKVFRNQDQGPLHAPEFTLCEWYRAGETYESLQKDCAQILLRAAQAVPTDRFVSPKLQESSALDPPEEMTVAQAFWEYARIDLFGEHAERNAFAKALEEKGVRVQEDDHWSDLFSKTLSAYVEPHLGMRRPLILKEYPLSEAALARAHPENPSCAERFELYVGGVELANAFGELTDPIEQRLRFETAMAERERLYGERYPIDEDFLKALPYISQASGCALGVDRLVMLATHAMHIREVLWGDNF